MDSDDASEEKELPRPYVVRPIPLQPRIACARCLEHTIRIQQESMLTACRWILNCALCDDNPLPAPEGPVTPCDSQPACEALKCEAPVRRDSETARKGLQPLRDLFAHTNDFSRKIRETYHRSALAWVERSSPIRPGSSLQIGETIAPVTLFVTNLVADLFAPEWCSSVDHLALVAEELESIEAGVIKGVDGLPTECGEVIAVHLLCKGLRALERKAGQLKGQFIAGDPGMFAAAKLTHPYSWPLASVRDESGRDRAPSVSVWRRFLNWLCRLIKALWELLCGRETTTSPTLNERMRTRSVTNKESWEGETVGWDSIDLSKADARMFKHRQALIRVLVSHDLLHRHVDGDGREPNDPLSVKAPRELADVLKRLSESRGFSIVLTRVSLEIVERLRPGEEAARCARLILALLEGDRTLTGAAIVTHILEDLITHYLAKPKGQSPAERSKHLEKNKLWEILSDDSMPLALVRLMQCVSRLRHGQQCWNAEEIEVIGRFNRAARDLIGRAPLVSASWQLLVIRFLQAVLDQDSAHRRFPKGSGLSLAQLCRRVVQINAGRSHAKQVRESCRQVMAHNDFLDFREVAYERKLKPAPSITISPPCELIDLYFQDHFYHRSDDADDTGPTSGAGGRPPRGPVRPSTHSPKSTSRPLALRKEPRPQRKRSPKSDRDE